MQDIRITIVGNLTADPELRFTPGGNRVAQLRIAHTPRIKQGDDWVDGETTFLWANAWGDLAEHIAESLVRGTRVIATGTLRTERWEGKDGEQREAIKLLLDAIGPDLRFTDVQVRRATREHGEPAVDEYQAALRTAREELGAQPV